TAPVVLASAPSEAATNTSVLDDDSDVARPAPQSATGPAALMHQASLKRSVENVPKVVRPAPAPVKPPVATGSKTAPAATEPVAKTVAKAAATVPTAGQQKASAKPKAAVGDPLAPMPAKPSVRKLASVSKASVGKPAVASKSTKDPAKKQ
ncbi:MAG: hypothetical protein ACJ8FB_01335, partial [Sphingomicrobium sp.]